MTKYLYLWSQEDCSCILLENEEENSTSKPMEKAEGFVAHVEFNEKGDSVCVTTRNQTGMKWHYSIMFFKSDEVDFLQTACPN